MNALSHHPHPGRFTVPSHQSALHLWRADLLRLARALLESSGQLGVVARAGQGKTQFAAQFCRALNDSSHGIFTVIWLGCEQGDGSAAVLAADLLAAAQRVLPPGALDKPEALSLPLELGLRGWEPFVDAFYASLEKHLPGEMLLVLDDIHHLEEKPALKLLELLLQQRPASVKLLWLARPMGRDLERVLNSARFPVLAEDRLALSIDEIMALYSHVFGLPLTLEEAVNLHGATQGWTLGIVLSRFRKLEGEELPGDGDGLMLDGLRRYFHDEYLGHLPGTRREFILCLALLEYVSRPLVLALAPDSASAEELDRLAAKGFFVRREGEGEYLFQHLFMAVLAAEARTHLTAETRQEFFQRAAGWHEQDGDLLAALGCHVQSAGYAAIDGFFEKHFTALLGLQEEARIGDLLSRLPASNQENFPWLTLARGLYPGGDADPPQVAGWLLLAERLFCRVGSNLGELRTLLLMARRRLFGDLAYDTPESLLLRIRKLRDSCRRELAGADLLLLALVEGQFGIMHAYDYGLVQNAVRTLLEDGLPDHLADIKAELVAILGHAECMLGHPRRGLDVLEQGHELLARVNLSSWARFYLRMAHANTLGLLGRWAAFEHDRLAIMREPEPLLNQTFAGPFLKIWDITRLTLAGEGASAAELARAMLRETGVAANPALRGQFQQYLAYALALDGHREEALHMAARSRETQALVPDAFFELANLLTVGATLVLCGHYADGEVFLDQVLHQQRVAEERGLREGALWLQALSRHRQNQRPAALACLGEALALSRERGGYNFIWSVAWLQELLQLAVRHGVEAEQAQAVARRVCSASILDNGTLVSCLDIHVLGPFAVTTGQDRKLELGDFTPIQRRLLGMLALRAEQGASVAEITAVLWPGVQEESARASLDTALLRLRKQLAGGRPLAEAPYLAMQNGFLSLRHARVDCWQFLDLCRQAEEHLGRQRPWQAEACYCEAFQLLRGRFAGHGLDCPETAVLGQRLEDAMARAALSWEGLLKGQGRDADAVAILQGAHVLCPGHGELTRRLHDLQVAASKCPEGRMQAAQVIDAYRQALAARGLSSAETQQLAVRLFSG